LVFIGRGTEVSGVSFARLMLAGEVARGVIVFD
jgi:hypothetical protein